jgi:putative serine protease PepD
VLVALLAGLLGGRLAGRDEAAPPTSPVPAITTGPTAGAAAGTDFAGIYEALSPSVVHIVSERRRGDSIGSGVIVDVQGTIITNNHVVPADNARVTLADGTEHTAVVIGRDVAADLAVLRLSEPPPGLVAARFGSPGALRVGDAVAAIGSPFGLRGSLSTGVVSGLDRIFPGNDEYPRIEGLIQTDAAINPGNSGGPLINAAGEVVGLTTAIESPVRGSVGVGFAVPIETVRAALAAITDRV